MRMPYSQGNIIQGNVETSRSPGKVIPDQSCHILTLCDQLAGVELGHNTLQYFVDDRRQNSLIKVGSKGTIDLGKGVHSGLGQDTTGDVDHLKVLGAGERGDVARLCADVIDNGRFKPWDPDMRSYKGQQLKSKSP